jgi:hypothetical protein
MAEGQRIYYNFVKPYMALEGQTPPQAAGIGVQGEQKWLELLTQAIIPEAHLNPRKYH